MVISEGPPGTFTTTGKVSETNTKETELIDLQQKKMFFMSWNQLVTYIIFLLFCKQLYFGNFPLFL